MMNHISSAYQPTHVAASHAMQNKPKLCHSAFGAKVAANARQHCVLTDKETRALFSCCCYCSGVCWHVRERPAGILLSQTATAANSSSPWKLLSSWTGSTPFSARSLGSQYLTLLISVMLRCAAERCYWFHHTCRSCLSVSPV